ncbi:unnamed protein product [Caenorhabditis nigoni]
MTEVPEHNEKRPPDAINIGRKEDFKNLHANQMRFEALLDKRHRVGVVITCRLSNEEVYEVFRDGLRSRFQKDQEDRKGEEDAWPPEPTSRTSRTVFKAEIGTIRIRTTCIAEQKKRHLLIKLIRFRMSSDRTYRVDIVISELFELSFLL